MLRGARIPLVLLQRGFEVYEYGCDGDEPDGEGSLVFLQISSNRILSLMRGARCKLGQQHYVDGGAGGITEAALVGVCVCECVC